MLKQNVNMKGLQILSDKNGNYVGFYSISAIFVTHILECSLLNIILYCTYLQLETII